MSTTAAFLVSRVMIITTVSMMENGCRVEARISELRKSSDVREDGAKEDVREEKEQAMQYDRLKRFVDNESGTRDRNRALDEAIKRRVKRIAEPRPRRPPTLPPGFVRVTEWSQYLSSESVSFYSHEDTSSELRMVYGHPDSSYTFADEPTNVLGPHDIVQILETKGLDPYLCYKAVAAEHELEAPDRMGVWNKLFIMPISVYRALDNFNSTKENIYKSLKKARELKLFTAPPRDLWNALHNEDPLLEENLEKLRKRKGWTTALKRSRSRETSVSPGDKATVERFKTMSRDIARILKNNSIHYKMAYEMCRAEKYFHHLEAAMIYEKFDLNPESIYNLTTQPLNITRLDAYRALKYLAESIELFRKPLGPKPELDGALRPQLYEQTFAFPSEEDVDVMEKYINYTPRSLTVYTFR